MKKIIMEGFSEERRRLVRLHETGNPHSHCPAILSLTSLYFSCFPDSLSTFSTRKHRQIPSRSRKQWLIPLIIPQTLSRKLALHHPLPLPILSLSNTPPKHTPPPHPPPAEAELARFASTRGGNVRRIVRWLLISPLTSSETF